MSDDVTHRLSAEGVDPLALAGVNDGNLLELSKRLGVRVSLRGDSLSLAGPAAAVERAAPVAQALVDLARMGETLDVHDVARLVTDEAQGTLGTAGRPPADAASCWRVPRSRRGKAWGSSRATCKRRWTRICGRYTTRSRT